MNNLELSPSEIAEMQNIGHTALSISRDVHDRLGASGAEYTGKPNPYGDAQLTADVEIERGIREYLRDSDRVWLIQSEEFPPEITKPGSIPEGTIIIDGLDGSDAARDFLLGINSLADNDRYATMVAIGPGDRLKYKDFVYAGINEHALDRITHASQDNGAFMQNPEGLFVPIHASPTEELGPETPVFSFDKPLFDRFNTDPTVLRALRESGAPQTRLRSSASHWVDIASGATRLITLPNGEEAERPTAAVIETTRKGMQEWPTAYRIAEESGVLIRTRQRGAVVDIGELPFLTWQHQLPNRRQIRGKVIVGATSPNVANQLVRAS